MSGAGVGFRPETAKVPPAVAGSATQRRNPLTGSQENRWVMTLFLEKTRHPPTALNLLAGAPDVFAVEGAEVFRVLRHCRWLEAAIVMV
jgi:hypothetical protein